MVYDWQEYRDVCYRMYIEERKSLEDIMQHLRDAYAFAPSKRAFQTQFRRWGFPSKHNPAHRNVDLVARVKELWENNVSQRDMLRILNEEGFSLRERELMRVRTKNRWLLRVPNGMKSGDPTERSSSTSPSVEDGGASTSQSDQNVPLPASGSGAQSPPLSPQVLAKRKERLDKLQAESDQRWQEKKRRRRTRGWAGLPADPPGPPRFPSETTLEESKTYLSLDDKAYRQVRDQFQQICKECAIIKKTVCGPEIWQQTKDRLIQENEHLYHVFWTDGSHPEAKTLALDVICTDVTKRIRTMDSRMTIAEAKTILGIDPEESRRVRHAFYNTLKADHFTSKLEAGEEHWKELKDQWIQSQPLIQSILGDESDAGHPAKAKALEVLCRDVMKRLRDDQTQRDPGRPERAEAEAHSSTDFSIGRRASNRIQQSSTGVGRRVTRPRSKALATTSTSTSAVSDMQIDPSLLQAANDPSFAADHQGSLLRSSQYPLVNAQVAVSVSPTAVYLRAHPKSQVYGSSKLWLGSLSTRRVGELRTLLASKWPNAEIIRIDGVERGSGSQEICYLIEEDDELEAYLAHVRNGKATFVALMNQA